MPSFTELGFVAETTSSEEADDPHKTLFRQTDDFTLNWMQDPQVLGQANPQQVDPEPFWQNAWSEAREEWVEGS